MFNINNLLAVILVISVVYTVLIIDKESHYKINIFIPTWIFNGRLFTKRGNLYRKIFILQFLIATLFILIIATG